MNTTLNINLGGQHFYMDQNAYDNLAQYLEAIKNHFKDRALRDEILSDIESRIAELFSERITHERQVITVQDVSYVIDTMGQPNAFKLDSEEVDENEETTHKRKLFRDPDDKIIGGVAAGLAHYFGLQVKWIRLIWLILGLFSWGGFIIIYLILWIILSEAKTTAEKLMMRGEPINISNLEKKIKEGIDEVAQRVKDTDYEETGEKIRSKTNVFFNKIADVFKNLFGFLRQFLGLILVFTSSLGLFILLIALFTIGLYELFDITWGDPFWPPLDIVHMGNPIWWAIAPVLVVAAIPVIYMLLLGKWIINPSLTYTLGLHLVLLGVWMFSILITIGVGMRYVSGFI